MLPVLLLNPVEVALVDFFAIVAIRVRVTHKIPNYGESELNISQFGTALVSLSHICRLLCRLGCLIPTPGPSDVRLFTPAPSSSLQTWVISV